MSSRELDPPVICFRNSVRDLKPRTKFNKKTKKSEPRERSSWDLTNVKFYAPQKYRKLTIINFYKRDDFTPIPETTFKKQPGSYKSEFQKIRKWALDFATELNGYGLETENDPNIKFVRFVEGGNYQMRRTNWQKTLDKAGDELCKDLERPEEKLLVIILPYKDQRAYSDIKWWADCWAGAPTLCLLRAKIEKQGETMGKRHIGSLWQVSSESLHPNKFSDLQ